MSNYGSFDILVKGAEALIQGPLPTPAEVTYVPPNPDGSRKKCGNCWKFVKDGTCVEVEGTIKKTQVCGYYVYGKPFDQNPVNLRISKLPQDLSGLVETPGGEGTSCGICKAYEAGDAKTGICAVVQKDGVKATVQSLGCCSRWRSK